MKTKIFFSHSKKTFDTRKERRELKFLEDYYSDKVIICPNHDFGEISDARQYNPTIDICSILIVSERKGYLDMGEFVSVARAFSNKTPVFAIRTYELEFYLTQVTGIEIINESDWIDKYAILL